VKAAFGSQAMSGCFVARTSVGSSPEAGDRDRLPPRDEAAHAVPELVGHLGGPNELDGHDIE
jgi:hypothetical protein